jgi:hypothetical protein
VRFAIFRNCLLVTAVAALLSFSCQRGLATEGKDCTAAAQSSVAQSAAYPLKLSANHRYLVDQNNKPFLIVGDSPQGLMGRLSEEDADRYFADREAHGFNTAGWMDVACAGHDFPDDRAGSTPDGILPFTGFVSGGTDYTHYDISKPNESYFARLDHMIQLAAKHGLLIFIDPMETIGWLPTLRNNGLAAAHNYGAYLGLRYKKYPNVAWISGNDFNNWRVPSDDALVQAVAMGIQSVDSDQLQTVEINVFTSSSLDDQTWAPIISLNSTYTYSATYIQMLHSYNQKPVLPAYLVEAHYDLEEVGNPTDYGTPDVLRREEYWTMLSGGVGQFYGNRYTWSLTPGWGSYIDTLGVSQLKIWKEFFSSLPWQNLIPDQEHKVVTGGFGTFGDPEVHFDQVDLTASMKPRVSQSDYATAAKTLDGSLVVVYLPTSRTLTVNMASLSGPAVARWFDPTNGAYTMIPGAPFASSGTRQFTPPRANHGGDEDWVLELKSSKASGS